MKIECPSDSYTAFGNSYLSTISNKLRLNPCNFDCCHSPMSQLYPPSKFCKTLQHNDNSVLCSHHFDAPTWAIRTYHQQNHLQHQQNIIPSRRNGSVRVDALRQRRQRHPGGGLLRARRQFNASHSISPSDRCFTVSSRSVGFLF
jgi:hypothetical protein